MVKPPTDPKPHMPHGRRPNDRANAECNRADELSIVARHLFVRNTFDVVDRRWAYQAVAVLSALGVGRAEQVDALTGVAAACRDSGHSCAELYDDSVGWALSVSSHDERSLPGKAKLRMPLRASWMGRLYCASLALIIWSVLASVISHEVGQGARGVHSVQSVLIVGLALFAIVWGLFLWGFEASRYHHRASVYVGCLAAVLVVAALAWGAIMWLPTVIAGTVSFAFWWPLLAVIPGVLGLWLCRKALTKSWPSTPVTQARWRKTFLTVMTMQKMYIPADAQGFLAELEADAAEIAEAEGKPVDLNNLGAPHIVAESFDVVDPETSPGHRVSDAQVYFVAACSLAVVVLVEKLYGLWQGAVAPWNAMVFMSIAAIGVGCGWWNYQKVKARVVASHRGSATAID